MLRALSGAIVAMIIGALAGAFALTFLFALTCLPGIIQSADWNNNFPPTVFMACFVMFGHVGVAPIGALLGAFAGLILGAVKAIRATSRGEAGSRGDLLG